MLGKAVVEVEPDVKNFGKRLRDELDTVGKDVAKSAQGIDKSFGSIRGNLDESFKGIAKDAEKELGVLDDIMKKSLAKFPQDVDQAGQRVVIGWRKTANGVEEVFSDMGKSGEKTAKQLEQEITKSAKEAEKALHAAAQSAAKEWASNMDRASKATRNALKESRAIEEREIKAAAAAAKKAQAEVKKSTDDTDGSFAGLGARIMNATRLITMFSSAGASLGGLIPLVAAIGSALTSAAGAALILPGALASIGLAGATVKLAFSGIGDAINADNAKKLDEAMKNLPPTAREFVTVIRDLKDKFDGVRKAVQETFFSGLGAEMKQLGAVYLPVLTSGLVHIAKELNNTAKGFAAMLKEGGNVASVRTIFESTREVVANLGKALAPIGQALLDIISVGSLVFAELTKGAGDAATKFAEFIRGLKESGQLEDIIKGGIAAFKQLWGFLVDIVVIVKNIFGPLIEGAGKLQTPLNAVLDTFRAFTASNDFANLMRDLGKIFAQLADAVGTVFGAVLKAALPVLQELISMLSDHLAKILPTLVPMLSDLAKFFGDLLMKLLPLLEPMFKLVQVLLPPLAELIGRVIATIDMDKLGQFIEAIATSLTDALIKVAPSFTELILKLGDLFEKFGPVITVMFEFMTNTIPPMIEAIGWVVDKMIWLIDFGITPLVNAFDGIAKLITWVWDVAKNATGSFVQSMKDAIENLSPIIDRVWKIFNDAKDAIGDRLNEGLRIVRAIPGAIVDALGNLGGLLWDAGARIIQGFIDGLNSRIDRVKATLGGLTSMIPSWKGPADVDSKLLARNGKLIMDGLVAGFKSGEAGVKSYLTKMTRDLSGQLDLQGAAKNATTSMNQMTTKFGAGGAITQAALAEAAATRQAFTSGQDAQPGNTEVHVFIGDQELTDLVTDVVVDRDRKTKRAVNSGARRIS